MTPLAAEPDPPAVRPARRRRLLLLLIVAAGIAVVIAASAIFWATNRWRWRLYTPTLIEKIGELYFIVDCWHHRVLYSRELKPEIGRWQVLDDDLAGPHSIASDGVLYVVDDTGRNGIRSYMRDGDAFRLVQEVGDLGRRTHRVRYDKETAAFYVLSAHDPSITKLVRDGEQLTVRYTKPLEFLNGEYTRSFVIIDGFMYFVPGPRTITKARYRDDSYDLVASYPVPRNLEGMNDLFRTDDGWYYVTSTDPANIFRARSLEDFGTGRYEDVRRQLSLRGIPYFLSAIDGRFFITQINRWSGILSFVHRDGNIADVRVLCESGPPIAADLQRFDALPQ